MYSKYYGKPFNLCAILALHVKKQAVFINLVYISGYASVEFKRYTIT